MADISKCSGMYCQIKEKCYRYTAQTAKFQSYILPQYDTKIKECPLYWKEV